VSAPVVLFVDDEEGLLELYRSAFTREGYVVDVAPTLDGARQRLAGGGVDLVVLDIRMAEGSGLALLKEIKSTESRLPVVLSTAFARYQDDFASWLADAYVVKSSDLGELKQAVRRCLERSQ
jgi:DNA-binding response OmpR family regulator